MAMVARKDDQIKFSKHHSGCLYGIGEEESKKTVDQQATTPSKTRHGESRVDYRRDFATVPTLLDKYLIDHRQLCNPRHYSVAIGAAMVGGMTYRPTMVNEGGG